MVKKLSIGRNKIGSLCSRGFKTDFKLFDNFGFASRPFRSFAPLKEKHFWPHVVG